MDQWTTELAGRVRGASATVWSALRTPRRPLVRALPLGALLVVPVLLAVATASTLFVHADVDVALLFSQCHARARVPWLSHVPVVGAPACFLVSFFQEALEAVRGQAVVGAGLAFVGALLTVSTVEAARVCHRASVLIAYPTGGWLVFNLVGGAMVWQLVILPAFLRQAKEERDDDGGDDGDATANAEGRRMASAEIVAIPTGVALGFVVPSVVMVVSDSPVAVLVWLFFPLYVSAVRQAVRALLHALVPSLAGHTLHLERDRPALLAVYALPVTCSVLAHGFLVYHLATAVDDRTEFTRATTKFIEIDLFFVLLTVLYWVLVEAGWRVVAIILGAGVVFGPGAGVCVGWIYREEHLLDRSHTPDDSSPSEATPLLR